MRHRCWIDESAWRELWDEVGKWRLRETGGALFGWRDAGDAVVANVLGPGPDAVHGFRSFEPDVGWQQVEGERLYRKSGRLVAYIGEWHTHPFSAPTPSAQDQRTAQMISKDAEFRAPIPLSAIVGSHWIDQVKGRQSTLIMYVWMSGQFEEMSVELCRIDRGRLCPP